jgi:hypothetical protein
MKSLTTQRIMDTTGFLVSALCAIHCLAVPILLSFAAFGGMALDDPSIEHLVLGVSAALGIGSLLPSYFKHHRKLTALGVLLLGLLLVGIGRFVDNSTTAEVILTTSGALGITMGHMINFKLCKKYHQI